MAPTRIPENNTGPSLYRIGESRDCEALNATLRARIGRLRPDEILNRHHFLGGRYENLYVSLRSVPELRVILDLATAQAAHVLNRPKKELRLGWWLNIMQPGDITFPHTHDAGDELLSGVYYIDVPPGSGKLVLTQGTQRLEIEPRAGSFVFFAPDLMHEVTRNESGRPRISLGFNVGAVTA
ncbi:MAG: 2OG-Fe(II) oxygenase [Pseudomonadota bacterium]